jgi:hypothetical protein
MLDIICLLKPIRFLALFKSQLPYRFYVGSTTHHPPPAHFVGRVRQDFIWKPPPKARFVLKPRHYLTPFTSQTPCKLQEQHATKLMLGTSMASMISHQSQRSFLVTIECQTLFIEGSELADCKTNAKITRLSRFWIHKILCCFINVLTYCINATTR